jgi:hypothetical protein
MGERGSTEKGSSTWLLSPYTAMKKLRIVTLGVSGGRSLTRPFRDARRFPLETIVARTEGYTYAANVWIHPSFKGHSLSPVPNPSRVTIRDFQRLSCST